MATVQRRTTEPDVGLDGSRPVDYHKRTTAELVHRRYRFGGRTRPAVQRRLDDIQRGGGIDVADQGQYGAGRRHPGGVQLPHLPGAHGSDCAWRRQRAAVGMVAEKQLQQRFAGDDRRLALRDRGVLHHPVSFAGELVSRVRRAGQHLTDEAK
jgi:hypothetical protein